MAVGIDISPRWQRGFDWSTVDYSDDPQRGVRYVWVKVSDGGSAYDFQSNKVPMINGAKSRGIPVGGYHFSQPGDPVAQADLLANEVFRLGATGVAPMLDLEDNSTGSGLPNIPDSQKRAWAIGFCNRIVARGLRPAVYMNNALAKLLRPDTWPTSGLVVVIARYGAKPDSAAGRYDVHQFASNGTRGGVEVDLDESYTNNHLTGAFTVSDSSNIQAIYDSLVAPKLSKVPGSTKTFAAEEFGRFTNANCYDFATNQFPTLQHNVAALITAFNQLGGELSQVFTALNTRLDSIDTRLTAIETAVGATAAQTQTQTAELRVEHQKITAAAASAPLTLSQLTEGASE